MTKQRKVILTKLGDKRFVREFSLEDAESYELAQEIKADIFAAGEKVDATAIPKVKVSRAQSRDTVSPEDLWLMVLNTIVMQVPTVLVPTRVVYSKVKRMAGHMGNKKVTVQNLEVVRVDAENNLLLVKGAVPGPKKSLVTIKETVKSAK